MKRNRAGHHNHAIACPTLSETADGRGFHAVSLHDIYDSQDVEESCSFLACDLEGDFFWRTKRTIFP
jgi:hypothetical protein